MVRYPDGTAAMIGDRVLLDRGELTGVVLEVIESEQQRQRWGLDELGLMVEDPQHGLMFWSLDCLVTDEIAFISREADLTAG